MKSRLTLPIMSSRLHSHAVPAARCISPPDKAPCRIEIRLSGFNEPRSRLLVHAWCTEHQQVGVRTVDRPPADVPTVHIHIPDQVLDALRQRVGITLEIEKQIGGGR